MPEAREELARIVARVHHGKQSFRDEVRSFVTHHYRRWSQHSEALHDPRFEECTLDSSWLRDLPKSFPCNGPEGRAKGVELWTEYIWAEYMSRAELGGPQIAAPDMTHPDGEPCKSAKACPMHVRTMFEGIKTKHGKGGR